MRDNFHSELATYIKNNDNQNATRLIFNELALSLVKDREDFIEVLRSSGVNVLDGATDLQLIDAFVRNAPSNKKMLLGASLLINHRNQTLNFDGESEISDAGVKNSYKQLDDFFNANGGDNYSNAGDIAGAVKSIVDVGGQITGQVMSAQDAKKRGASTALQKQSEARKQMIQNVIAAKQQTQQEQVAKNEAARKQKKILLIAGASILGLALIIGAIVILKKNK